LRGRADDLKGRALVVGVRFAAALAILTATAAAFRDAIAHALVPLYFFVVGFLASDLDVLAIGVGQDVSDSYVYLDAALARPTVIRGSVRFPQAGEYWTAATLSGYALQVLVLCCSVLCAWPASSWRATVMRIVAGTGVVIVLLCLDAPMVLLATLLTGLADGEPEGCAWWMQMWSEFLAGGGRIGLALALGAITVALAARVDEIRHASPTTGD